MTTTTIRTIQLPEQFYEVRRTLGGGEVCDVIPYEGASDYVAEDTPEGTRYGIRMEDGEISWMSEPGQPITCAFGEGADVLG